MSKIKGRNVTVYLNNVAIGVARTCSIRTACDLIEVSSLTSQRAREFVPGRTSWDVSIASFIPVDGIDDYMLGVGSTLTIQVKETSQGTSGLQGSVIVTEANLTADVNKLAAGQQKFMGTGPLTKI